MKNGVCLTVAGRLRNEEALSDWPCSIRVAVSAEMSEDDIKLAADVVCRASASTSL